jgi:hypothetical protein
VTRKKAKRKSTRGRDWEEMDRRPIAGRRPRRAATQKRGSYGEMNGRLIFLEGWQKKNSNTKRK